MFTALIRRSPSLAFRDRSSTQLWFGLSLAFALAYGCLWLRAAFGSPYAVQTDTRMYVFWLQRLTDPTLLPHDLNVDYHSSIAPIGYTAFYRCFASLGISAMLLSKVLPVVLGLITTAYCFGLTLQLFPIPAAAWLASLLLNQSAWLGVDLNSASPRGFVYPLFMAFLYYLSRGATFPILILVGLLGLFYPPTLLIGLGLLVVRLWRWQRGRLRLSSRRRDYWVVAAAIGIAAIVLVPEVVLNHSAYGPMVSASQAKVMPEFLAGDGRISFFHGHNPWRFWFDGTHTGIRLSLNPPIVGAAFLLPVLCLFPSRFPLIRSLRRDGVLLPQLVLVSLGLFFAAHALLFHLFLPSRYTVHSLLIVMAIAGGIALWVLLDTAWQVCSQRRHPIKGQLGKAVVVLLVAVIVLYPHLFWKPFAKAGLVIGGAPAVYEFFQHQPRDTLVASLAEEAGNLPVFAQRSVLVAQKYAIPYHLGYYRQVRQRVLDLMQAQYSLNRMVVQAFIHKYGIDYWLVERTAFTPEYLNDRWLKLFEPANAEARAHLAQGKPILAQMEPHCAVLETEKFIVLQTRCLLAE